MNIHRTHGAFDEFSSNAPPGRPLVSSTMTAEGLRGRNISSSVIGRLYSGVSDWQRRGGGSGSGDGDGCDLIGEKCDGGSDVANGGNRRA